jgi:hypothetical protein
MAGVARVVVMAAVFLLPGGSLLLAAYAAHTALKQRAWLPAHRAVRSDRLPR